MYTTGAFGKIRIVALGTFSDAPVAITGAEPETDTAAGKGRIVAV
jgi:hypothetical protein